ncbi:MAG: hypothetical protein ABIP74_04035 [Candidatus Saccharimonas sp.]
MECKIPGTLRLDQDPWKRENERDRDARVARISEARELIEAGVVPSDAEASDFFATLGADVEALSLQDMKLLDDTGALMTVAMFHYDRAYSWDWLDKLTPELRSQVETELGISVVTAWQEAKHASEATPKWPLYVATLLERTPVASQPTTQSSADVTDTYGVGTVTAGEVLPMRAEPGSPDTLDFSSDTFSNVIDKPWEVLPPEEWMHRLGSADFSSLPKDAQLEAARAYIMRVMDSDEDESDEDDF